MTFNEFLTALAISVPVVAIVAIGVRSYWYREFVQRRAKRPAPHELPPIDCTPRLNQMQVFEKVAARELTPEQGADLLMKARGSQLPKVIVRQNVVEMPKRGGPKDGAA